ncbi:hypothetical protein FOA52_006922 [Chlamydomonas sp. UWO 241]|nr:hypothetical protein FOA52_006922 [Chlamydomonas sp. UWO 241]
MSSPNLLPASPGRAAGPSSEDEQSATGTGTSPKSPFAFAAGQMTARRTSSPSSSVLYSDDSGGGEQRRIQSHRHSSPARLIACASEVDAHCPHGAPEQRIGSGADSHTTASASRRDEMRETYLKAARTVEAEAALRRSLRLASASLELSPSRAFQVPRSAPLAAARSAQLLGRPLPASPSTRVLDRPLGASASARALFMPMEAAPPTTRLLERSARRASQLQLATVVHHDHNAHNPAVAVAAWLIESAEANVC